MTEIEPIGRTDYALFLLGTLGPLALFVFGVSLLFLYLEHRDAGLQFILLIASTVFFLICVFFLNSSIDQKCLGRLKSIDPEYPGGSIHDLYLYVPLLFIFSTIFLLFKKPNSMEEQLYPLLRRCLILPLVGFILFISLILAGIIQPKVKSQEMARWGTYWLMGPATYFITELVYGGIRVKTFTDEFEGLPDDEFIRKSSVVCSQQVIPQLIFMITAINRQTSKLKKGEKNVEAYLLYLQTIINATDRCSEFSPYPKGFNPTWSLIPTAILEGSFILLIENILKNLTTHKQSQLIGESLSKLKKQGIDSPLYTETINMYKTSTLRQRSQQIQKYSILNSLFKALN